MKRTIPTVEQIAKSVEKARANYWDRLLGYDRPSRKAEKQITGMLKKAGVGKGEIEELRDKLKAGTPVSTPDWFKGLDRLVFWELAHTKKRDLSKATIAEAITAAAKRNDHNFFRTLVKALNSTPVTPAEIRKGRHALLELLMDCWLKPSSDAKRSFCYWSDEAIAVSLRHYRKINAQDLSPAAVRKMWQRLGLKKGQILVTFNNARDERVGDPLAGPSEYASHVSEQPHGPDSM